MLETSLELLKKIESQGFEAYIVGGFVRDHLLGIPSSDVDINTSATPKIIKEIFKNACLPNEDYGSVTVIYNDIRFEITTYRKELNYIGNRRPASIEYITDLREDLKRRDFTINTLCMNSNGDVIDLLNGIEDLQNRTIVCVNNSFTSFNDDALRILRAIRFATVLNFRLSEDTRKSILSTKGLLKNISYDRKKEELGKIFTSENKKYGIALLEELKLNDTLELFDLEKIRESTDLLAIWLIVDKKRVYPYTRNEREIINQIRFCLTVDNLNNEVLYNYGLYINLEAASIKGFDRKLIVDKYNAMPIKTRKDIDISSKEVMNLLNISPSPKIKDIFKDIEREILSENIINEKKKLEAYIISKYK